MYQPYEYFGNNALLKRTNAVVFRTIVAMVFFEHVEKSGLSRQPYQRRGGVNERALVIRKLVFSSGFQRVLEPY